MGCSISNDKVVIIMKYLKDNSKEETMKQFKLTSSTLDRYSRIYKNEIKINDVEYSKILKKIEETYSDKELRIIANGGRLVPGQSKVPIVDFIGKRIRFGYMTDLHLGSIYAMPDWVVSAFKEMKKEKCEFLCVSGDITDGMSKRLGHVYELTHIGCDAQKEHSIDVLKQWGKKMYVIDGNHDRWYLKDNGTLIVKDICKEVKDAEFLGHDVGDISLKGGVVVELWHGEDGSSYATSYRIQKIVESLTGGEKPSMLLAGHVHKQAYIFERHIHCFSGGAMCKQSRWMKSKRLANHSGFWIIDIWIGGRNKGISKCRSTWYPFYA